MSDYIKREDAHVAVTIAFNEGLVGSSERSHREIDKMPAADVEPVRHGHWINDTNYSGWTCSECGDHDGAKTDNYCHNCGAKMDEEQEYDYEHSVEQLEYDIAFEPTFNSEDGSM